MKKIVFVCSLALCSCASQTSYRNGIKSFQNYGDLVGNVKMEGLTVTQPAGPIPIMRTVVINKKGEVVGINEVPMLAGVYNSRVNQSMFDGFAKTIRAGSNFAGTIGAVMLGGAAFSAGGAAIP